MVPIKAFMFLRARIMRRSYGVQSIRASFSLPPWLEESCDDCLKEFLHVPSHSCKKPLDSWTVKAFGFGGDALTRKMSRREEERHRVIASCTHTRCR
mmetsp:Transcript_29369/g.59531  ORF Transcript_29369/g.59531 Transcript_29369/m.59531 type:complete len:97 (+) Transcript_29369:4146-4436(+)